MSNRNQVSTASAAASWYWAALLVVAVPLVYWPALNGGFIWDDDLWVTGNKTLLTPAGLWSIWFDPAATPQYYPLVHTSFWLEHFSGASTRSGII